MIITDEKRNVKRTTANLSAKFIKVTLIEISNGNRPYQTSCIFKMTLNCFECILTIKQYFEVTIGYFWAIL